MTDPESMKVFDSQGEHYKRAFQIFLDHTDQKRNAKRFLQTLVNGLPERRVFIDAGALDGLVTAFRAKQDGRYQIVTTMDPAHVETQDPAIAYAVAEFMLNLLPISRPPARRDVEDYLTKHCATSDGAYRLSVHQDFLQIRLRH